MKHLWAASLLLLATPALADDDDGVRELTECRDMGELIDIFEEFEEIDADRRDVVDIVPNMFMIAEDGLPLPERMFAKLPSGDGMTEIDFTFREDGLVEGEPIMSLVRAGGGELCSTDPNRMGTPRSDYGIRVTMGMLPQYLSRDAEHTMVELEKGAKDGRKFFKKMAPGAVSFLVPKLDHVAVSHPLDDKTNLPTVTAWRGEESLGPVAMEPYDSSQLLSLDTLEEMGADRITVAGDYRLYPMPDAKTLKRFSN